MGSLFIRSHKKRWIDSIEDDVRKMGVKRWRIRTDDRKERRGTSERPVSFKNYSAM
jgi:hypothetical protein